MNHTFDVLVVGGGLAGCAMSAELRSRGADVAMIDEPHLSSSSRNALGVINPLVLRSLRLQEQIAEGGDNLDFPIHARRLYGSLLEPRSVVHVFGSKEEQEKWDKRSQTPEGQYLGPALATRLPAPWEDWRFNHPHGWARVRGTGLLKVAAFIAREQAILAQSGRLFRHALADHEIHPASAGVVCHSWSARQAIFCEGWRTMLSPLWHKVALKPAKGETLTVELGGPDSQAMPDDGLTHDSGSFSDGVQDIGIPVLHRDIHVIARSLDANRLVLVGATHTWDDISETTSQTARAELLFKLERLHDGPLVVIDQRSGIRPASRDRRPILGRHPDHPNLAILNGLGTRGILLAPGLAWLLANALDGADCIPPIWDVRRFWRA